MKLASGCINLVLIAVLQPAVALAQERPMQLAAATEIATVAVTRDMFIAPVFVGSYRPDGTFSRGQKTHPMFRTAVSPADARVLARPVEVPPWIDLHPIERVVEDKAYRRKAAAPKSKFATLVSNITTFVYGRELVLRAPAHLTTDLNSRLIIADPDVPAIHVLDGKNSFRIQGGEGRRLQRPSGLAVDAENNIYVADEKVGSILIYSPDGTFSRMLGRYRDENMFERPSGLAIDRENGFLYVLDSAANELLKLNLDGRVLNQVGGRRSASDVTFDRPTQVAARAGRIVVVDAEGTRVRVFDPEFVLMNEFQLRKSNPLQTPVEVGLALDDSGNIYVSDLSPTVRIYRPDGKLIGRLDNTRATSQQQVTPAGLWIDEEGQVFVSDPARRGVQVYAAKSNF